jgi:hypothetical protein
MKTINANTYNSISIHLSLFNLKNKELDISDLFNTFEIIEDIQNFTLSGSISIVDTIGLKENFPILGGERLKVLFNTGERFEDFQAEFIIVKLADEQQINLQRNIRELKLYFVSEEFLTNIKQKYSKSYNHETVSNIVQDIFSNQLKSKKIIDLEQTKNTINYIIPFKNPFDSISFCCKHALSNKNNDSGFLFYENKQGFHFKSLQEIMNTKIEKKKIILQRISEDERKLVGYVGIADYFYPIKQIDLIESIKKGVTGSSLFSYDISTKSYMKHDINYEKSHELTELGNNLLFPENFQNTNSNIDEFTNFVNDRIGGNGIDYDDSINQQGKITLRNKILYHAINNNSIVVSKPGDSELYCGSIIECEYKSAEKNDFNDYMNGWMMVKSIRHKITLDEGYKQILHLSKPFYNKDDKGILKKI